MKGSYPCRILHASELPPQVGRLLDVMAALRTPGTGCPWDLVQTFTTIAPYTIEEAYEVADAIDRGHMSDLKEELGDLLLQVVYHARMAEEQGDSRSPMWRSRIADKMVRRHPARVRHARAARGRRRRRASGSKRQSRGDSARVPRSKEPTLQLRARATCSRLFRSDCRP